MFTRRIHLQYTHQPSPKKVQNQQTDISHLENNKIGSIRNSCDFRLGYIIEDKKRKTQWVKKVHKTHSMYKIPYKKWRTKERECRKLTKIEQ